jgi:hypothetical protein
MRKLHYSNDFGNRELQPGIAQLQQFQDTIVTASTTEVPTPYTKGEGTLSGRIVCVISGGTDRERALLYELERKRTFCNLHVIFISSKTALLPPGGLTPNMMKREYDRIVQSGVIQLRDRAIKLWEIDKIYLFTDVDHYYKELQLILQQASQQEKDDWIISNPDIEIWIYYCYRQHPEQDLQEVVVAQPESTRSSLLKTLNGRFNNGGGLDTRKTFEHLQEGINNARAHYAEDAYGIPLLLSTQMYRFAEDVIQTLGDEYTQWQQQVRARNIRYRK